MHPFSALRIAGGSWVVSGLVRKPLDILSSLHPPVVTGSVFLLLVLLYKVRLLNLCFFAVSGLPRDLCPGQSRAHLQVLGAQRGSLVQLGCEGVWFSCVTHWHSAGSWAGMQDFYLLLTALLL